MISLKVGGIIAAAFIAGAFVASPELRAFAANTVGSADIINNSIQSVDIKDGEVKTADIATGAVAAGRIADGAVGTLKIADNSIAAVDIATDAVGSSEIATNGVGAAEIAPNAVGASEIAGVSELLFSECALGTSNSIASGELTTVSCTVNGARAGDVAIVTRNNAQWTCFPVSNAAVATDKVDVFFRNVCEFPTKLAGSLGIIVFDTAAVVDPPI
jgi:hypothetical protein